MMKKVNQSISYLDLLSKIERSLDKMTSESLRLEAYLTVLEHRFVKDVNNDERSYLLVERLARVEQNVHICGTLSRMLYASVPDPSFMDSWTYDGPDDFVPDVDEEQVTPSDEVLVSEE